jgi:hypothetical protein
MNPTRKRFLELIAGPTALVGAYWASLRLFESHFPGFDTDLWYHQAISRFWLKQGILRTLPQAEDLSWDKYFPDKEFLFHAATAFAYRLGGEAAIASIVHALAATVLVCLYFALEPLSSRLRAFLLVLLLAWSSPYFVDRLFLARPAVLAILCFVLLLSGFAHRSRVLALLGAAGFALSYHAIYVPLMATAVWAGVAWASRRRDDLNCACWGLAGLALGTVTNPYFPSNILFGAEILGFALESSSATTGMEPGGELAQLSIGDFLYNFLPAVCALTFSGIAWFSQWDSDRERRSGLLAWIIVSLLLAVATIKCPRGSEYWIPAVTFTLAAALRGVRRIPRSLVLAAAVLSIVPIYHLQARIRHPINPHYADFISANREAIAAIPAQAKGKKVLNCTFGIGELILHDRDDLRFTDLLDPMLLKNASPFKFEALRLLKQHLVLDTYGLIRDVFNADYVICDEYGVSEQLRFDPRFLELGNPARPVRVFELAARGNEVFARSLEISSSPNPVNEAPLAHLQGELKPFELPEVSPGYRAPYLNLNPLRQGSECFLVRPSASELSKHSGSVALGVGGGPSIQVWIDGRPWYRFITPAPPALVSRVARLPHPLRMTDRLEFLVCPGTADYLGISISFWEERELKTFCNEEFASSLWQHQNPVGAICQDG